jgi:hypothetical protein
VRRGSSCLWQLVLFWFGRLKGKAQGDKVARNLKCFAVVYGQLWYWNSLGMPDDLHFNCEVQANLAKFNNAIPSFEIVKKESICSSAVSEASRS